VTGRRGRRRKQLLDDCKEKTEYCTLKEEALDRTVCRTRFGRRNGPVVRQTEKNDSELYLYLSLFYPTCLYTYITLTFNSLHTWQIKHSSPYSDCRYLVRPFVLLSTHISSSSTSWFIAHKSVRSLASALLQSTEIKKNKLLQEPLTTFSRQVLEYWGTTMHREKQYTLGVLGKMFSFLTTVNDRCMGARVFSFGHTDTCHIVVWLYPREVLSGNGFRRLT
jgi:hypothetical protein